MATVPALDEIECISEEIQPQILVPSHSFNDIEVEHVCLKVENNTHSSGEGTSGEVRVSTLFGVRLPENTYSRCIIYSLLFIILAVPLFILVTIVTIPALLVINFVARLVQLFVQLENFHKICLFKAKLRYIALSTVIYLLIQLGLFYPFAKYVPRLKHVIIVGLPITDWIVVFSTLIGIYLISLAVWYSISWMIRRGVTNQSVKGAFVLELVSEIIGCLLFRWALSVFMNMVPAFKLSKILDIYTSKWIEIFLFLLIGYNISTLLTYLIVWSLSRIFVRSHFVCSHPRYLVYIAFGIQSIIVFILSILMVLLTWVLYFGDRLNSTSRGKRVFKVGTGSLVSFLICTFLWLIKISVLLYWKAHFVYNKLHYKIPEMGHYLYFFVLLSRAHHNFLQNNSTATGIKEPWVLPNGDQYESERYGVVWISEWKLVREKFLSDSDVITWPVYDLQEAAQIFLIAHHWLGSDASVNFLHLLPSLDDSAYEYSREDYDSVNIITALKKIVLVNDDDSMWKQDWEDFLNLLRVGKSAREVSFQQVKIWMERAHANCSFLANVLIGEEDAAICLNNVLTVLVIGVTFISWLLICEWITTTVLVLIATPMLAASFMFGDTCKTLFQGLIFIYVIHPFNVGDHCIIDEKQLEVKRLGVWSCIFSDVHAPYRNQDIVYANSELATKKFIKCKTEIDWNDYIEFNSSFLDNRIIQDIKANIESYFNSDNITTSLDSIEFQDKGDNYKVAIKVKYNAAVDRDLSYYEFMKEREKLRSELSIDIRSLLQERELRYKKLREYEIDQE